jgi:hypothetical protein
VRAFVVARQQKTRYPDNNPKSVIGIKKPSFHAIPATALLHLGAAMADGERKYGLTNWRGNSVAASVYVDAKLRHLLAWWDSKEEFASDSKVHHLGHDMACDAILLDAIASGNLIDDRPEVPGAFSRLLAEWTMTDLVKATKPK